jgi:hypothetical protein
MVLSIWIFSFAYAGCGGYGGDSSPTGSSGLIESLKALNIDKYMGITFKEQFPNPDDPEWDIYYYDKTNCKCIFEDEFYIAAREKPDNSNVIFMMSGGGACWPGQNDCTSKPQKIVSSNDNLTSNHPNNPVAGWDVVWVPYCDGSIHAGDSNADYDRDGDIDHWHWGLKNTSAAVTLMQKLFPAPDKILITGCSAGGYGTFIATMLIRLVYPDAKLYVVNEAGPGLFNPDKPETWQLIKDTWNMEPLLPRDCPECHDQMIYLYKWMLARDDNLKIGLFSSYRDEVIGGNYLGMAPLAFEKLLVKESGALRQLFPDTFKRYFINGSRHCVFDYRYKVNGISIIDWIDHLVNDETQWADVLE